MASVRQQFISAPRRPAELTPGELVWASIINGIENPNAMGKARPVILVSPSGSAWRTMGLTTRSRHRDNTMRVPVPNPCAVGLARPGWLWSSNLCFTSGIDILDHIGWVDLPLAFEVIKLAGLPGTVGHQLLAAAREHHGTPSESPLTVLKGDSS
jgi:hypothetical protein